MSSGVGIRGMRERLSRSDGEMKIESDSTGARVLVSIPVLKGTVAENEITAEPLPSSV